MRLKILSCMILLLPLCGFSQGEFNNWFFGNKAAVTFNTSPPTNIPSTQISSATATASVSDSNGFQSSDCFSKRRTDLRIEAFSFLLYVLVLLRL
jgi:hypothetical protein